MRWFFNILFILLFLIPEQKDPMYNKQGKPSTYGINQYIKNNQESLIKEYEYRIDSLYDAYIYTENLSETSDEKDLGEFYLPDYIVKVSNARQNMLIKKIIVK